MAATDVDQKRALLPQNIVDGLSAAVNEGAIEPVDAVMLVLWSEGHTYSELAASFELPLGGIKYRLDRVLGEVARRARVDALATAEEATQ